MYYSQVKTYFDRMAEPRANRSSYFEKKRRPKETEGRVNDSKDSSKSRLIALLLCFFLGWAGGHRFYVKKVGTALLMLFTMGGFGMWYFLDLVMIASGVFKDKDNHPITTWK